MQLKIVVVVALDVGSNSIEVSISTDGGEAEEVYALRVEREVRACFFCSFMLVWT